MGNRTLPRPPPRITAFNRATMVFVGRRELLETYEDAHGVRIRRMTPRIREWIIAQGKALGWDLVLFPKERDGTTVAGAVFSRAAALQCTQIC